MGGGTDANVSVKLFGTALPNGTSDLALDLSLVLAQSPSEPSLLTFIFICEISFSVILCCSALLLLGQRTAAHCRAISGRFEQIRNR